MKAEEQRERRKGVVTLMPDPLPAKQEQQHPQIGHKVTGPARRDELAAQLPIYARVSRAGGG